MKISLEWLGQFVTWTDSDPAVIAERLTRSTAEVEELEVQGALLAHCCVGEIVSLKQHPDADRLKLAEVKTDKGIKNVVCGGTNLYEGMLVAFAHVGATVKWHGGELMKLEPVKIRGVASEGMICAAEELGLESLLPPKPEDGERPVIDLSRMNGVQTSGARVSTPLRDALHLTDTVLHFSNTAITARPDLFSHIGFARECVALGLAKPKKTAVKTSHGDVSRRTKKSESLAIKVDCPDLVPRYLSASLSLDSLGETPEWMKQRLASVGIRSISLPVDITNYVMIEIGVPMHCFDADDIDGTVHMRLSTKKESLMTLDNKKWDLPEGCLVLSDDKGVFDLVGIMGGLRSSTKDSTKNIFLHALSIDPVTIRKAIIGTGLRTDASTVYEKGVPGITTEQGFYRALELMLELIPGAKLASEIDEKGHNGKAPSIKLSLDDVRATLGLNIGDKEIVKILEDLGCEVKEEKAKSQKLEARSSTVTPPLHRLRDLVGPHDILEEIGRIHGFDKVEPVMPSAPMQLPKRDLRLHKLREDLVRSGYWELMPLSFVSPQLLERCNLDPKEAIKVKNPIGEETSLMHTCPLPQLLVHAEHMLPRAEGSLSTFQCANVFDAKGNQTFALGMLLSAKEETDLLDDPLLVIKGQLLDAVAATGQSVEIHEMKKVPAIAHPGRSADVVFRGKSIGKIYEIHPVVRQRFGLTHRVAGATLDLSTLLASPSPVAVQKKLSIFPAVTYDVTVTRTQKDALGPLLRKLRSGSELLEAVSVHDLYAGKPLEKGSYNLTLRFVYRAKDRTLTEEEVKKEHGKALGMVQ